MSVDHEMIPEQSVTNYEVGQDNVQKFGLDIHNPVFPISAGVIILFVAFTLIFPAVAGDFFGWLRPLLTSTFDWLFLIAGNIFVLFCLALIITPLGGVRLGGKDARPDYGYFGWFAMLFAAGMGIGLVFYGVSEPISHYSSAVGGITTENGVRTDWSPLGGAEGETLEARRLGMAATLYHWALHPWAIYAIVALGLAFFSYNWGLPLTIRSVFYPLLGDRVWGWPGHIIDTLAVFATIFGLATSLGFGAEQASAGLNFLFGIPDSTMTNVVLIAVITAVALVSVIAGLDGGVKRLSEINMVLALLLLGFVFLAGPTMDLVRGFFGNTAAYFREIVPLSVPFGREDDNFRQGWTTFYWAWWMSWSPFVGMFIARVSRGRTVREFVTCVLIVPTIVSIIWMTVFGGTALTQTIGGYAGIADAELPVQLFEMLSQIPLSSITSFIGIVLVIVFFVTSSDSGSLVIDTITAGGKLDAPTAQRVFWATFEGLIAIALLLGGGLAALQAAAVATGFPFVILLLILTFSVGKGLIAERKKPFLQNQGAYQAAE
ncbi:transporter, BCCT family protein [Fulvimarina pelagi HTCC2506]|uniref:Transporter, BCCT family protein n=1 Tax=Fulvimarina pelagi HTCC2506 TaxID=314231 RepID=Q0G6X9_9HYPH|nr:BCCT family transporter [Fulvimarina pelagi]EAU42585.1 transporter, BCCT family protein [Fulvimarina pelagi HTCC2506]